MAGPLAQLVDETESRYKAVSFGASAFPKGCTESAPILPDKAIGDQSVFPRVTISTGCPISPVVLADSPR